MFFLAGLLGMMALGSVVVVSTAMPGEDDLDGEDLTADPDVADSLDVTDIVEPFGPAPETQEPETLFARLGLTNLDAPSGEDAVPTEPFGSPSQIELASVTAPAHQDAVADPGSEVADTPGEHGIDTLFGAWDDEWALHNQEAGGMAHLAQELTHFDGEEERLVIVYDDSHGDTDPHLEMRQAADGRDVTEILVDGEVLASLPTAEAPALEAIVLIGESVAEALTLFG